MGKCVFNRKWLSEPKFSWVREFKGDRSSALCSLCNKIIDLGKMGEYALTSHMKSKKHIKIAGNESPRLLTDFYTKPSDSKASSQSIPTSTVPNPNTDADDFPTIPPPPDTVVGEGPRTATGHGHGTLHGFVSRDDTLRAEILWTIHTISQHCSYKSNDDVSKLFPLMFSDSEIAKKFSCGERKSSYMAVFGIAEHFKENMLKQIKGHFSVLFDESLNKKAQTKQMDIHVRFWDNEAKQVRTRYLTSQFLGHATAADMVNHFTEAVVNSELDMNHLVQIGMDGPNVNWKFHELMSTQLKNDFNNTILNIGSCGLHVLHNSFKAGGKASEWRIDSLLSSIYYLYKDSPARREDFLKICGGENIKMPLKFCNHRWLENEPNSKRTIEIWPNLVKYVQETEKQKAKPTCNSYCVLKEFTRDRLVVAKLEFFRLISSILQPYLASYQTDKPVICFMASDLSSLLRSLLRKFIKPDILAESDSVEKLAALDVCKKENYLTYKKVDVGINTEKALREAGSAGVSEKQVMDFRMQAREFLCETCKKILLKCPLSYLLVRKLSSLDPTEIAANPEACRARFKYVLVCLKNAQKIGDECDLVFEQYNKFIDSVNDIGIEKFANFSRHVDRVDEFYANNLSNEQKYGELMKVVKIVLVISHGQACVERGFSVNKEVETINMSQKSLIAQRLICDYVSAKGGILKVPITKELLTSVGSARHKYERYLEEMRKQKHTEEETNKRKSLLDEIDELKVKRKRLKTDISALNCKADNLAMEAEKKGQLILITQSNCMRKRSKEKQDELKKVEDTLSAKVDSLKQ